MGTAKVYAADTRVPVAQSRAEIERLLEKHKAKQYGTAVDHDLRLARVQFKLHDRVVRFVINLPDPQRFYQFAKYEQAERQRWRALLLVIKAKLEAVESAITTFEQEFMAHTVLPNDQTVSEVVLPLIAAAYQDGRMPQGLLPAGPLEGEIVSS
jgi:hypothetical protein